MPRTGRKPKSKPSTDPGLGDGTGPQTKDDEDLKKLRNRLSQRAFRRRQAAYIKELKERVDSGERPQSEIIAALQEENSKLRKELIDVQSKLARMIVTMQVMAGSVSDTLGDSLSTRSYNKNQPAAESIPSDDECPHSDLVWIEENTSNKTASLPVQQPSQNVQVDVTNKDDCFDSLNKAFCEPRAHIPVTEIGFAEISAMAQQIPNIWSFEYQMGPESYTNACSRTQGSSLILGKSWTETNSPFSDHVNVLQQLLKEKVEQKHSLASCTPRFLYHQVLMVLSLFNSITRPDAMTWYSKTRIYQIVHLMTWQLYPCAETFNKLHKPYRPTATQIHHQHPSMIDWIPFPSIRYGLIRLHAANPNIDQIFCDAVSSYVVETWMSNLILGAPMTIKAYVRVTDLLANMDSITEPSAIDLLGVIPAPDAATLFSSPQCSHAVFKVLNMDRGASYYKIDPAFFGKYPELYDPNANITAEGIPLRPDVQTSLTSPRLLDTSTFQTYRSFIDYSMDAPFLCAAAA